MPEARQQPLPAVQKHRWRPQQPLNTWKPLSSCCQNPPRRLLQSIGKHAAAGQEHAFACRQLLAIACACLDLTDASSRNAASGLVQVKQSWPCRGCAACSACNPALQELLSYNLANRKIHVTPEGLYTKGGMHEYGDCYAEAAIGHRRLACARHCK